MSGQRNNALIVFDAFIDAIRSRRSHGTFIRRNGILILVLAGLTVWTWATSAIVRHNTVAEMEESIEAKYNAKYTADIKAFYEAQEDESKPEWWNNMMTDEVPYMSKLANRLRTLGLGDTAIETYLWSVPVRVDNPSYPSTIKGVITQPKQYDLYDDGIKPTDEDDAIAIKVLSKWHDGKYPNGLTVKHEWAVWTTGGDAYLRNSYETDSKTNYWRIKNESDS